MMFALPTLSVPRAALSELQPGVRCDVWTERANMYEYGVRESSGCLSLMRHRCAGGAEREIRTLSGMH